MQKQGASPLVVAATTFQSMSTSRKNTAEMLRRLRKLTIEIRMLKANIDAARMSDVTPRLRQRRH